MESLHGTGDSYRLIVTRRNASEILLLQSGSGWALPRVEIQQQQRVAEQLTSEVGREWGIEAYCLFVPSHRSSGRNGEAKYAVMESVTHNGKAPAGTYWMPRTVAVACGDAGEVGAIKESLEELEPYARGDRLGPFARPGWLRELFSWTQEQVAPLGLRVTGGFRQLNASPTFSLIRMETDDCALWFKATGEPNSHETPKADAYRKIDLDQPSGLITSLAKCAVVEITPKIRLACNGSPHIASHDIVGRRRAGALILLAISLLRSATSKCWQSNRRADTRCAKSSARGG